MLSITKIINFVIYLTLINNNNKIKPNLDNKFKLFKSYL